MLFINCLCSFFINIGFENPIFSSMLIAFLKKPTLLGEKGIMCYPHSLTLYHFRAILHHLCWLISHHSRQISRMLCCYYFVTLRTVSLLGALDMLFLKINKDTCLSWEFHAFWFQSLKFYAFWSQVSRLKRYIKFYGIITSLSTVLSLFFSENFWHCEEGLSVLRRTHGFC